MIDRVWLGGVLLGGVWFGGVKTDNVDDVVALCHTCLLKDKMMMSMIMLFVSIL